ncbi:MAG: type II toxin-antitoxin system prevent-host-death family antitoxin [Nitrospirae bacterium]|nr:type II toxin-antitoxin system prevent-host-death family antitoxin [Nitrospirota bacterium]
MRTVEAAKAKPLAEYAEKVKKEPLVVTSEGKPVAVLVGIKNADMETVSLSNNPRFLALIERSRTRRKLKVGISTEEMRRRLKIGS